jgi:hypothetical protein
MIDYMCMDTTTHTTPAHTHTPACLGGNELNEVCCGHPSTDARMAAHPDAFMRHTVTLYSVADDRTPLVEVHTWTDSDEDAIALARADYGDHTVSAAVTFRDVAHYLDAYVSLGCCEDVPNSVVPVPQTPVARLREAFEGI